MVADQHCGKLNLVRRVIIACLLLMTALTGCSSSEGTPPQAGTSAQSASESTLSISASSTSGKSQDSSALSVEVTSISSSGSQASSSIFSANASSKSRPVAASSASVTTGAVPTVEPALVPKAEGSHVSQSSSMAAASSSTASLNLDSLEQRLRDTKAIGVFTKLSLKNQVDDLLTDFRSYYQGKSKMALTDLRQRYDLLLMKILTLLQDTDVSLATDIRSSREAIWNILRDPEKFAQIS